MNALSLASSHMSQIPSTNCNINLPDSLKITYWEMYFCLRDASAQIQFKLITLGLLLATQDLFVRNGGKKPILKKKLQSKESLSEEMKPVATNNRMEIKKKKN